MTSKGILRLRIPAGKAAMTPPVGPALGQRGIKAIEFIKAFNEKTKNFIPEIPCSVYIHIEADKTYRYDIRTPPVAWFIKRATGIPTFPTKLESGCFCGTISIRQCYEIAKIKHCDPGMNMLSLEAVCRLVVSTCLSLKVEVIE